MVTFVAATFVIFVCGFTIARIVNVFWKSSSITRDAAVTLFQGAGLAAVMILWNYL